MTTQQGAPGTQKCSNCARETRLLTIGPVTTGHAMVIPKKHLAYLSDMDESTGRHLWTVTQRTAEALRYSRLPCEGVNLFLAEGKAAFQEIFHVHMHVFPRYAGDLSSSSQIGTSIRRAMSSTT
jgi:diadenosine tetraphosphate (Ap4A) HIT family hydrolase